MRLEVIEEGLVFVLEMRVLLEMEMELDQGAQVMLLEVELEVEAELLYGSADQAPHVMELEVEEDVLLGSADRADQTMLLEVDAELVLEPAIGSADQAAHVMLLDELDVFLALDELEVDAGSRGHELELVELLLGSADHGPHEVLVEELDELVLFGSTGQLPDDEAVLDEELDELTPVGPTGQPPWLTPSVERALLLEVLALPDEVVELPEPVENGMDQVPEDDFEEPKVLAVDDVLQVLLLYKLLLELELVDEKDDALLLDVLEVERVLLDDEDVDFALVLDVEDEVVDVLLELFVDDDVELVVLEIVLDGVLEDVLDAVADDVLDEVLDVVVVWQTDTPRLYSGVTQGYPVTVPLTVEVAVVRTETSVPVAPGFAIVYVTVATAPGMLLTLAKSSIDSAAVFWADCASAMRPSCSSKTMYAHSCHNVPRLPLLVESMALMPTRLQAGILDPSVLKKGSAFGFSSATRADTGILMTGPPAPPKAKLNDAVDALRSQGTTNELVSFDAPSAVRNKLRTFGGSAKKSGFPVSINILEPPKPAGKSE